MDGIKGRISEFFETNGQRNWTSTKEKKNVTNRFFYGNITGKFTTRSIIYDFFPSLYQILLFKYLYSRVDNIFRFLRETQRVGLTTGF